MTQALTRYRVMAWVVGCWLLLLVLVAMPLKYGFDSPGLVKVVGPVHGFLYMVYLVATLDLARRARWTPVHTIGVMLAGTAPFLSFVVERRTTEAVRQAA